MTPADTSPARVLIPFAFTSDFDEVLRRDGLSLPHLNALLPHLAQRHWLEGDELTPSLPHERLWLHDLYDPSSPLPASMPLAALHASQQGLDAAASGWAFIHLCHWQVTPDRIVMGDPAHLQLDEASARAMFRVLQPWFAQDGIALHWDTPTRWLACSPLLADLATASLERVIQRDVRPWLPAVQAAPILQRLQTECQMLLYNLPENDARTAHGLPPVNAFWVSGSGALPADWNAAPAPRLPRWQNRDDLRHTALHGDWHGWKTAWEHLDATVLADLRQRHESGEPITLGLAGERHAVLLETAPAAADGLWSRWQGHWQTLRQRLSGARTRNNAHDTPATRLLLRL